MSVASMLVGVAVILAVLVALSRLASFRAQKPQDYATGPQFDIRERLNGPIACEGIIYGPTGRVTSRFTAQFEASWEGNIGRMTEVFHYDSGAVQNREWTLRIGNDGRIHATAPDLVGAGTGQQMGSAVQLNYRIKLPDDAGGHVLDTTDWMYLMQNGAIMNRSQFRKFGIKVAELVATMRPVGTTGAGRMTDWAGKRYWLVGASEGLGRALAHQMSRAGVELIVSARSRDRLDSLVAELPGKATAVTVDVADDADVRRAAEAVGEIDGVVYLAGVYWPMKAQDWDAEKATLMAEINFLGASRVVGAVIGPMVARDAGHVVLTGSLSGFRSLPGAIGYAASKAGLMALAESMYADLRKTNVRVQLANPGFIKTRLTDKNDFTMPFIMEPEDAARAMFTHMNTDAFKVSFPLLFSWVFRLSQFMPDWMYYRVFGR